MSPFIESTNGNRYVIILTEYLTRWCEAKAIPNCTANTVATFLLEIICRHACPKAILPNQSKQFKNEVLEVVSKCLGITQRFSSNYQPQTNGPIERMNQTIKRMLRMYVDPSQINWDAHLQYVVHAYNTSAQQSLTRISPFRALYGRDLIFPSEKETWKVQPTEAGCMGLVRTLVQCLTSDQGSPH